MTRHTSFCTFSFSSLTCILIPNKRRNKKSRSFAILQKILLFRTRVLESVENRESRLIQFSSNMEFEKYLSSLPEYNFAVTYGSGVFKQVGYSEAEHKNAMLDVIIGVEDPTTWHKANMEKNSRHYSSIRHLSANQISKLEVFDILSF